MNWLANLVRPGFRAFGSGERSDRQLWGRCPGCGDLNYLEELARQQMVCHCGHHHPLKLEDRFRLLFDDGVHERLTPPEIPVDPLRFRDRRRYADRLREARQKLGPRSESVAVALGSLGGIPVVIGVMDFAFMGGSMGTACGEAIVEAARVACERKRPLILVTASGGARMQEGILSLMQMPRTTIAVRRLARLGLPYLVVLTHPTTGGVSASFAMLGDVTLAEPGAVIGFAGQRVIEETVRQQLPDGFQRAEYLLEHGMIDDIVSRPDLKQRLAMILDLLIRPVRHVPEEELLPPPQDLPAPASSSTPASGAENSSVE